MEKEDTSQYIFGNDLGRQQMGKKERDLGLFTRDWGLDFYLFFG